ncbi:DUF2207 domain-containing protein [Streptomyces atratus]|uniref:DUF2207 domain-containing protein n=1 Tax=Streptomyces atratus TaxID=1893 RepID=UPI0033D71417
MGRIRRRRRWNLVAMLVAAVVLGGIAALSTLWSSTERVARLWTGAELSADGRARITEVIDYDFGHNSRHGIFRDVPGLPYGAKVSTTMDGKPVPHEMEPYMGAHEEMRVRIGDAQHTITGRHRYRIQYELADMAPAGTLAWNAVGTGWGVPLSRIEIHVSAPFTFGDIHCVSGLQGSGHPCQAGQPRPGHLTLSFDNLKAHQGATLHATSAGRQAAAPASPAEPSGPVLAIDRPGPLRVGLSTAGIALAAGLLAGWLTRRAGRERIAADTWPGSAPDSAGAERRVDITRLEGLATETSFPPEGLTPAQGGVVLAEDITPRHQVAWLLSAADDGYLVLDDNQSHPTLTRPSREQVPRTDRAVRKVLDQAFAGRDSLLLGGSYDRLFFMAWHKIADQLREWRDSADLWDSDRAGYPNGVRVIGLTGALFGLIAVIVAGVAAGSPHGYWSVLLPVGAGVAGAGVALVAAADELLIRTAKGTALWLQVESFRRYLAGAGAQHVQEAADAGRVDQYSIWATALGVADHWSQAVSETTVPQTLPSANRSAHIPLQRSLMAVAVLAAVSSTTRPPASSSSSGSDSSSGSSGGYSVGDGGGGGGGGSW